MDFDFSCLTPGIELQARKKAVEQAPEHLLVQGNETLGRTNVEICLKPSFLLAD